MNQRLKQVFLALFFLSGASGLVYEIAWSRLLLFVFGGTTLAVTTVLTCFMGGLALGSYLGGRFCTRLARPERAYGILEVGLGAFCTLVPVLFQMATPLYGRLAGLVGDSPPLLTLARVLVSGVILLVPTTCMGATLPLLAEAFARRSGRAGRDVGRLYGFNTAGAFAGCVVAGFWLLPAVGIRSSIWLAALVNLCAGAAAFLLSPQSEPAGLPAADADTGGDRRTEPARSLPRAVVLGLFGASGFAAMGFQVAWTRALVLSLGSTTYAFSSIVSCFILGLAVGSLTTSRRVDRWNTPLGVAGGLEAAIALSALMIAPLLGEMPGLVSWLSREAGASFGRVVALEMSCVLGLLLVPTFCMGALLPIVCRICDPGGASAGRSVGDVYAANTAGTILGAAAAGFVLIPSPAVGVQGTMLFGSALSGLIATVFLLAGRRHGRPLALGLISAAWLLGAGVAAAAGPWNRELMVSGPYLGRARSPQGILFYREGDDATVAVTGSREEGLSLRVNGKPDASTGWPDMVTQQLSGQLPLLLRADAQDVCVIGLGSGTTVGAVLSHPVARVDVAEISPAVCEAARYFSGVNNGALTDPRVHLRRADGRNFLLLTDRKYDVVISEPSNPWMSGVANLFTREFFTLARARLKPGGIHCQWMQGYRIETADLGAVLRTFGEVFPHTQLWSTGFLDFLIIGSDRPLDLDLESQYLAFGRPKVRQMLGNLFLNDPLQLANHYVADGRHLKSWTDSQRVLTDDRPDLEYSTSRRLLDGSEETSLRRLVYGLGGDPALKGNPSSLLNRYFLQAVERARRRELFAAEASACTQRGDVFGAFPNLVQAALCGATDPRSQILTALELRSLQAQTPGRDASQWASATLRRLDSELPNFAQVQAFLDNRSFRFAWPFSRTPPHRSRPEIRGLCDQLMAFAEGGDVDRVLAKADEIARLAPDDPKALQVAGRVILQVAGGESARPFLLKAWSIDDRDPGTCYALARCYCLAADRKRALFFLEAAVDAGLRDPRLLRGDPLFAALWSDREFLRIVGRLEADGAEGG